MERWGKLPPTSILREASAIVEGRRNLRGAPERNLQRIADMWGAYLGLTLAPSAVAIMMILLKVARINTGRPDRDNLRDIIGYAILADEIADGEDEVDEV